MRARLAAMAATMILSAGCGAPYATGSTASGAPDGYATQAGAGQAAVPQRRPRAARKLRFNEVALSAQGFAQLELIEAQQNAQLPDGDYWYDAKSGAVGMWGGPMATFIPAGLALPGPLPAHASASKLPVFINGRAIHQREYDWFAQVFGRNLLPGQYWLDHNGNLGQVGGGESINLVQYVKQQGSGQGNTKGDADGDGDGHWNSYDPGIGGNDGIGMAGDGKETCVSVGDYTRCYDNK